MGQSSQPVSRFRRIILRISQVQVIISCAMLALMMFISTADVIGRYLSKYIFFMHPITGVWEIVSYAFVVCGAFALGYTQLVKGNISINLISDRLKPRVRAGLFIFSYLICIVASTLITWQGWLRMITYAHKTIGGETITLGITIWPFMLIFTLGFFWVTVIFAIDIYDCIVEVFKR
jgi:TRAP-type C4-dicarboxylate transport system permease small subunit